MTHRKDFSDSGPRRPPRMPPQRFGPDVMLGAMVWGVIAVGIVGAVIWFFRSVG